MELKKLGVGNCNINSKGTYPYDTTIAEQYDLVYEDSTREVGIAIRSKYMSYSCSNLNDGVLLKENICTKVTEATGEEKNYIASLISKEEIQQLSGPWVSIFSSNQCANDWGVLHDLNQIDFEGDTSSVQECKKRNAYTDNVNGVTVDCSDTSSPQIVYYSTEDCTGTSTVATKDTCVDNYYKYTCKGSDIDLPDSYEGLNPDNNEKYPFIELKASTNYENCYSQEGDAIQAGAYKLNECIEIEAGEFLKFETVSENTPDTPDAVRVTKSKFTCSSWTESNTEVSYYALNGFQGSSCIYNGRNKQFYSIKGLDPSGIFNDMDSFSSEGIKKIFKEGHGCDDGNLVVAYSKVQGCIHGETGSYKINCDQTEKPVIKSYVSNDCSGYGKSEYPTCNAFDFNTNYFSTFGCQYVVEPIAEEKGKYLKMTLSTSDSCGEESYVQYKRLGKKFYLGSEGCVQYDYARMGNEEGLLETSYAGKCEEWIDGVSLTTTFEKFEVNTCKLVEGMVYNGYYRKFEFVDSIKVDGNPAKVTHIGDEELKCEIETVYSVEQYSDSDCLFSEGEYFKIDCGNSPILKYYEDSECNNFIHEGSPSCSPNFGDASEILNFVCKYDSTIETNNQSDQNEGSSLNNGYVIFGGISAGIIVLILVLIVIILIVVNVFYLVMNCIKKGNKSNETELDTLN